MLKRSMILYELIFIFPNVEHQRQIAGAHNGNLNLFFSYPTYKKGEQIYRIFIIVCFCFLNITTINQSRVRIEYIVFFVYMKYMKILFLNSQFINIQGESI